MSDGTQQSRTEQATPRRLERAQQEGQIAYSTDLTAAFMVLNTSIAVAIFSDYFIRSMTSSISRVLLSVGSIGRGTPDGTVFLNGFVADFANVAAPIAIVATLSTLSIALLMTGFKTSFKAFKFDPSRIHPKNGLKRIFSVRAVVKGLSAIAKVTVLLVVVAAFVYSRRADFLLSSTSIEAIVRSGWSLTIGMAIVVSAALLVIGIIDFLFQKWKHLQDMKMSRQEVVDERREDDGDPHIKARLRKLQREMGQRRMMDDVRDATVVITNPTHFAVALKYDRDSMTTPKVVAKGADHLALKIIAIAKQNGVMVLERKPLARALFHTAKIGDEIPFEVFQAVAEVIAYVYQRKNAA